MKSISFKIIGVTLAAILISVLAIGSIGIYSIVREAEEDANHELTLLCDNRRKSINAYLSSIEQSANMIAHYAGERMDTLALVDGDVAGLPPDQMQFPNRDWLSPKQQKLDSYLNDYLSDIEISFKSVSNHTNGIVAYYFRLSPSISQSQSGFLYSKVQTAAFTKMELSDISQYDPDDISHVGWYYEPIRNGRPTWIGPYENQNYGINLLSYVVPIYRAGVVIGVIGMDIRAQTLIDQIENLDVYETGYAFLADKDAFIVYHPTIAAGSAVADYDVELASQALALHTDRSHDISLIQYTYEDIRKMAACAFLSDGLSIIVTAPLSEINEMSLKFSNVVVITGILIAILFSIVNTIILRRIIRPLKKLTVVARRLTEGDYDVQLDRGNDDEVGILTDSFQHLIDHLKVYISDLNSKAYSDALTNVRNKAGFDIFSRKVNDQIHAAHSNGQYPEFAVAMFDCNELKSINDTFGHDKGDLYLQTACKAICTLFTHSDVFRLGGDEFVVFVQGDDYLNRQKRKEELQAYTDSHNSANPAPWEQIGMAMGMAVYMPDSDACINDVLKRADHLMYEDKRLYKQSKDSSSTR